MNTMNSLTAKQAQLASLGYVDITETESVCLLNQYENGLYHLLIKTAYMKYEFYVDAARDEVLGVNTEPVPYPEVLSFQTAFSVTAA